MDVMDKRTLWMGALLLAALSVGCGSSNKPSQEDAGDSGLEDAGKPDAGKKPDASTTTPTMTAMPVPCGTNICMPPAGLGGLAGGLGGMAGGGLGGLLGGLGGGGGPMVCCLDESKGQCGMLTNGACMPPPTPDPRCPSLSVFGMMISGCCVNNMCGTDASMLGMGCSENGMAAAALNGLGLGTFIMIPPAQTCDHSGEDAGPMMSGGGSGGSGGSGGMSGGEDAGH
jgi:hypothetical protein